MTKEDLDTAKTVADGAWRRACKAGEAAVNAREMLDRVPARDTDNMFMEALHQAEKEYADWKRSVALAHKALDEYYGMFRPK